MADWTPEGAEEWKPEGAEEVSAAPAAPTKPSMLDSAIGGASKGVTLGWNDELSAGLGAVGSKINDLFGLPEKDPEVAETIEGKNTAGERYRALLERYRAQAKAQKEAHPLVFGGSELAGGIANPLGAPAKGAKAATLGARVLQGAKSAAPLGVIYGAGASEAPDALGTAGDAVTGGLFASGVGGAAPIVGAGVRKLAGPVADYLKKKAIEQGTKAISGVISPLAAKKPVDPEAVERALKTFAIRPLGTTQGIADRLQGQADELGPIYGQLVKDLEAAGVEGPNAIMMAQDAAAKRLQSIQTVDRAGAREWGLLSRDLKNTVPATPFASKRLPLSRAEEIKQNLQNEAKSNYDVLQRKLTPTGEAKMNSASFVRQAVEDAIDQQASKAPDLASQFKPVKRDLSLIYDALGPAQGAGARALRRKPISLTSTIVGSAAGEATGNPLIGLLTAVGHGLTDKRLPSTVASGAYGLSRLVRGAGNLTPTAQDKAGRFAALIAALRGPGARLEPVPVGAEERRDR